MRYENWDVLVFPQTQFKIPLQEFKTSCQVITDPESEELSTGKLLLPTVTGFIPSLTAGAAFRVSIHSWQAPIINPDLIDLRQLRSLETQDSHEAIMFEARLFIDGRLSGMCTFAEDAPFPLVMDLGVDIDKYGNNEKLQFPPFHEELLKQSYWNAADDLGRLKVVISEGFQGRTSPILFERMKNIVSFSFQHAPLDVLEKASLAWPNAAMWRQPMVFSPTSSPTKTKVEPSSKLHTHHSPRCNPVPVAMMVPSDTYKAYRKPSDASMAEATRVVSSSTTKLAPPPVFKGYRQSSMGSNSTLDLSDKDNFMTEVARSRQVSLSLSHEENVGPFNSFGDNPVPYNTPDGTEYSGSTRKPFAKSSGNNKRQRTISSAASKVIDAEDLPRTRLQGFTHDS
ncbi:hypothetical protein BJ878DRAFT_264759 [Calycina marina]|uniref:Uncharacterized protein n=1 Tax=Calycina marina TaxID=1763456 RepID=A0A9P8CJF1_9HELO|nr:hypothetical protein BJ878DRAFT_264759 [Calycina marina]